MSDQRLVNMALKRGFITPTQLEEAQHEARILADHGIERHISFILLDLGYLNDEQLSELRNSTSSSHVRALEVNGYLIEGRLGSGGMGDVFKARGEHGEYVAVKIMPMKFAQDEEYLFRFHREVNVMTSLQHPNITGFLDAGDVDGRLFLIMELVDGPNLKEFITKNNSLSENDVLSLIEQMANALQFAQKECGIIHRDIKPANIILGDAREGVDEPFCAKLCDFGLAKLSSNNRETMEEGHLTQSGMAVGTPHYMSPEVATGEKHVDQRADIYGLAATAYHAITGSTMYAGRNSGIIMYQQATSRSTLRHWKEKEVSPGMRALLEDMLSKDLFARIQDWDTVLDRVRELRQKTMRHRISERAQKQPTVHNLPKVAATALSDSSVNKMALQVPPRAKSKLSIFFAAMTVLFIIIGVSLLFWTGNGRYQYKATPQDFHSGLEQVKREIERQLWAGVPEPEAHLILQPGVYVGPIILDESCNMMRIYASGPGVRIIPADGTKSQPLILCRTGVRNVHIHGVTLDQVGDVGIAVEANAEATFTALHIVNVTGSVMDISGTATVRGLHAKHFSSGVVLRPGAQLSMKDSVLAGSGTHFSIDQAHAHLTRCRFQQLGNEPTPSLLSASGGRLTLDSMVLSAPSSEIAMSLDRMDSVRLENVSVDAALIGIRSHESRITNVSGLSIRAQQIGLYWSGPWELTWSWQGQDLQAPQPIRGAELEGLPHSGAGASQATLDKIPSVDGI